MSYTAQMWICIALGVEYSLYGEPIMGDLLMGVFLFAAIIYGFMGRHEKSEKGGGNEA